MVITVVVTGCDVLLQSLSSSSYQLPAGPHTSVRVKTRVVVAVHVMMVIMVMMATMTEVVIVVMGRTAMMSDVVIT